MLKMFLSKYGSFIKNHTDSLFYTITFIFISQSVFAEGVDILAKPAANIFATFKGTGVALLIVAEIVGAHKIYSKTGDMRAWVGLPVLLVITGWAATKI